MGGELEFFSHCNTLIRATLIRASLSRIWYNKPGRAELQTLYTWERAIELLTLRSPTFASAWQLTVEEAKTEIAETQTGVKALMRKVFFLSSKEEEASKDEIEAG
ncbi:MAG: hypothetical protein ACFB9N_12160 [Geitlerinemataceae cyanobacterium]